ncbi:MAG: prenyltransferase/squalene oxidase repeat-containing protein [Candidatus Thorarchaeota archaeon]
MEEREIKTKRVSVFLLILLMVMTLPIVGSAVTPDEIEEAVADGVAWLADQQNPNYGHWPGPNVAARTGFGVLKLIDRAFDLGFESPFDENYEYSSNVALGLNEIFWFSRSYGSSGDMVYFAYNENHWVYKTGICMMAIAASNAPDRIVEEINCVVYGWTYREVLQAAVNYMVCAQKDDGGWGYGAPGQNPNPEQIDWTDNSNSGYAVLGLLYAQKEFGLSIPQSTLEGLDNWIDFIQNKAIGASGYNHPNSWHNILKTGSLLFQMALVGDDANTPRAQAAIQYIEDTWDEENVDPGWKGFPSGLPHYQAMYTTMKGFEAMGIETITVNGVEVDWYDEFSTAIVQSQQEDGSWPYDYWGDTMLATMWALLALEREMAVPVAIPINVDIKPGSWPNPINPKSEGIFSLAICGTADFDVGTINPEEVLLSVPGSKIGTAPVRWSYEDVATPWSGEEGGGHDLESDGYLDIVFHFDTQDLSYATYLGVYGGETIRLQIQGRLYDWAGGNHIRGHDYVRVKALGDNLVVAIDLSKTSDRLYSMTWLAANLASWGAEVYFIEGEFSIPADANILLIPAQRFSYSADELEAIDHWFSEDACPRLLWVAGDSDFYPYQYYFTPDASNDVLNTVGSNLRISADTVEDYYNNDDAAYRVAAQTPVSDGALNRIFTRGVSSVIFHGPTSVLGYRNGVVVDLMIESMESVELIMRSSEDAVYNNWDSTTGEFDYYSFNGITGSYPMMAIQTVSVQKYVIVSGEVIFSNYMHMYDWVTSQAVTAQNPNAWNNGLHDGKLLVDNILYWFWHTY